MEHKQLSVNGDDLAGNGLRAGCPPQDGSRPVAGSAGILKAAVSPLAERLVAGATHLTDRWVTFTPHWVTVTVRKPLEVVQALVADHFLSAGLGDDPSRLFDESKRRPQFYDQLVEGNFGITIASGFFHKVHDHCCVNVPGSALEQLPRGGIDAVASFLGHLLEMESPASGSCDDGAAACRVFKVTRLDLAFDGVPFDVAACIEAAMPEVRNVRSPVKRGHGIIPLGEPVAGEDGATFKWGSRCSDRSLRVYDRRGPVRLELEARREKADLIARDLVVRPVDEWAGRTIQHLRDFIDFVQRDANLNISRAPLLPWWKFFVQGVERVRLKVERASSSLVSRVVGQVKRNRRTIAKAVQAFGWSWLEHHAVTMGNVVLTARDRREVTELRDVADRDPDAVGLWPSLKAAVSPFVEQVERVVSPPFAQFRLSM